MVSLKHFCVVFIFWLENGTTGLLAFTHIHGHDHAVDEHDNDYNEKTVIHATKAVFFGAGIDHLTKRPLYRGKKFDTNEIREVAGIIQQLFAGRFIDNEFTALFTTFGPDNANNSPDTRHSRRAKEVKPTGLTMHTGWINFPNYEIFGKHLSKTTPKVKNINRKAERYYEVLKENRINDYLKNNTMRVKPNRTSLPELRKTWDLVNYFNFDPNTEDTPIKPHMRTGVGSEVTYKSYINNDNSNEEITTTSETSEETATETTMNNHSEDGATDISDREATSKVTNEETINTVNSETTEESAFTTTTVVSTTSMNRWHSAYIELKKSQTFFDIPMLINIIANLTMDYDVNLTQRLNETLQNMSLPLCPTSPPPETTTPTTTTEPPSGTGRVVSKCFVCGLDTTGIPQNAHCSDAFSSDFMPLIPVDHTARGHIAQHRKYCTWRNVKNVWVNRSDPRSVHGRWTGGCAVRWIDVSGVYTQRTCRNKNRATMGKHFLSKRMAKLEMALNGIDNGCIVTPLATLVPFSRGISLFARFHACVCTGNWCNNAFTNHPWIPSIFVLSLWLILETIS